MPTNAESADTNAHFGKLAEQANEAQIAINAAMDQTLDELNAVLARSDADALTGNS